MRALFHRRSPVLNVLARRRPRQAGRSADPTRSGGLRVRYRREVLRRWGQIERGVRQAFTQRDIFGLQTLAELPAERAFAEGALPSRIERFFRWFVEYASQLLDIGGRWQERLVRAAWRHGERLGEAAVGRALPAPPAATTPAPLQAAIQANQDRLQAILEATSTEISEALGQTLLTRPNEALPSIERALEQIARRRSDLMAETGVVEAINEGTLHALERLGVETVAADIEVVFTTQGDTRVCQRCRALSGNTYRVADARGVIPVHARCRCHWVPAVPAAARRRPPTNQQRVA